MPKFDIGDKVSIQESYQLPGGGKGAFGGETGVIAIPGREGVAKDQWYVVTLDQDGMDISFPEYALSFQESETGES